ncbi:MAG: signal peptidase II, partial [Anaerolineae bacterium]
LTKHWVRMRIPLTTSWQPVPWLDPIFTFTHARNTGAAFGLFGGMNAVFIILALVVVTAILVIYRHLAEQSWLLRAALALQLGGAVGNLIDRVTVGYVTDFFNLRWWPIFNVADASIVVGTVMLAIYALFFDQGEIAQESASADPGDASQVSPDLGEPSDAAPPSG